jgi:Carbohydrate esterase 2 N-terminal
MRNIIFLMKLLLFTLSGISYAQNKIIAYNSPDIYYQGRIMYNDSSAVLSWPGSSVNILFEGTEISAILIQPIIIM